MQNFRARCVLFQTVASLFLTIQSAVAGASALSRDDSSSSSSNASASMNERQGAYRNSTGSAAGGDAGSAKWRIKALEARVAAQQDEIRELKAQLAEREQSLTRLQQRNGVLGARLEDKENDIATLEGRLAKLKRRLKDADSFAPRAWAVKEAVQVIGDVREGPSARACVQNVRVCNSSCGEPRGQC